MTTAVVGVAYLPPAGRPLFTYTNTLASPPLLTTTTGSTALGVFALQVGSSLMSILGFAGAVPVNFTVPPTPPPWAAIGAALHPSLRVIANRIEQERATPSNTRLMIFLRKC